MQIAILEDSGSVLLIEDPLREAGYETIDTYDYRDLVSWLIDEPDGYDILILDLMIPSGSLKYIRGCKDYNADIHHSPTLYFLKQYLLKNHPELQKRIILFSAYFDEMRNKGHGDFLEQFITVSKHGADSVDKLLREIDAIVKNKLTI
jgi:hypothetical protein